MVDREQWPLASWTSKIGTKLEHVTRLRMMVVGCDSNTYRVLTHGYKIPRDRGRYTRRPARLMGRIYEGGRTNRGRHAHSRPRGRDWEHVDRERIGVQVTHESHQYQRRNGFYCTRNYAKPT